MAVGTIPAGDVSGSEDATANAFLDRWKGAPLDDEQDEGDAPEGQEDEAEGNEPEEDEGSGPEGEGEDEEGDEGDDAPVPTEAGDDALVKVKVGDQEHKVKVADLKRLFGQEAALTQRSQETAQLRERADAQARLAAQKLGYMVQKAQARLEAVSGPHMDIAILARDESIPRETLLALRKEQDEARQELEFLQGEQQELHQGISREAQARHQDAAKRSFHAISDPASPVHIPDFPKKYQGIMEYGVRSGIPQQAMLAATDPVLFKILDKAMAYDAGKNAATKKVKVVPKVKTLPKNSARAGASDNDGPTIDRSKAMRTLRNSGNVDDAAKAFLSRWAS